MMTNKKDLKRTIDNICGNLFAECVAASLYAGTPNPENVSALLTSILQVRDDYVKRISHPEPGMKAKEYFRDLKKNFQQQVDEIIDQIANLS